MDNQEDSYKIDFDEYILNASPDKQEKGKLWACAAGLQKADGLTASEYLYETAKKNIEGHITVQQAKQLIDSYYERKIIRTENEKNAQEADKVSARIAEILSERTFSLSPAQFISIHKRLFTGIFSKVRAGALRDYNITKKEWVLDGATVLYAGADLLQETLKYDFETEKNFDYSGLTQYETIRHLTNFIANLWQIHPFGEGNTRTTAVFAIKYFRALGFSAANELFEHNSWYFRNALVRANYSDLSRGIHEDKSWLEKFLRCLALGEKHIFKNRNLHIRQTGIYANIPENDPEKGTDLVGENKIHSFTGTKKANNDPVNVPEKIRKTFRAIAENPRMTAKKMAELLSVSEKTVKRHIKILKDKNLIQRRGSDKKGYWEIARH
ncbi:MAG: Fic family protein [Elusimicrobiales bacterium]|nr:Fic family protein [Elusimicrobiales bacterium]